MLGFVPRTAPQLTRRAALQLALGSAALLAVAACSSPPRHVGKEPVGERRSYHAHAQVRQERAEKAADEQFGREVDADERVEGVFQTHLYHRPDCPVLKDVRGGDRVPFVSGYDALDAGYSPCTTCHPEHGKAR